MEAGNRPRVREIFDGTPADLTVEPKSPFQLIDVTIIWDVAPTTPEEVIITSINSDGDEVEENAYIPATASTTTIRRFDKRFDAGSSINVAYPNTDENAITVNLRYQIDQSVV